jgi:hypothetical protein
MSEWAATANFFRDYIEPARRALTAGAAAIYRYSGR